MYGTSAVMRNISYNFDTNSDLKKVLELLDVIGQYIRCVKLIMREKDADFINNILCKTFNL